MDPVCHLEGSERYLLRFKCYQVGSECNLEGSECHLEGLECYLVLSKYYQVG